MGGTAAHATQKLANWEGSISNLKIFEEVLPPEEIVRFCGQKGGGLEEEEEGKGEENESRYSENSSAVATEGTTQGMLPCSDKIAQHVKFVSNSGRAPLEEEEGGTLVGMLGQPQAPARIVVRENFPPSPQYL